MNARNILAGAAALALVVAIVVGGYLGGWWLRKDTTDRQVSIDNRQLGTQTAWRDEATDLINTIDLLPEGATQVGALTNQACDLIGRLTNPYLSDDLAIFQSQEC